MAIPFFSIDLKTKDFLSIFKNIIFPFKKDVLERKFREKLSFRYPSKFISLLPSGRLGFYLTLKFLFKPNDLVAFSSMSFPLYIKIAKQLKLKVKLIDISDEDLNINHENLKNLSSECKGIIVTHLFGNPCKIKKIQNFCKERNITLIEDCAQSFGSKFEEIETGNFGEVGIISTSLLKIPTTLSGGILVTKNESLHKNIQEWMHKNLSNSIFDKLKLFIKIFIFILNSYPKIYSLLSDKIFFFLKKYNPRIYRKILYSGMGMKNELFDPRERPNLSKFQIAIGLSQLERCDEMTMIRRKNSQNLQTEFSKLNNIKVINNHFNNNWNHQYFVIQIKNNFEKVFNKIFNKGVHVMDENVWNCASYNFDIENKKSNFEITNKYNNSLLRIQNNSFLNDYQIKHIAKIIADSANEK
jgi:dTDP-4-amino-4,6-dideoxygalactose transaminase